MNAVIARCDGRDEAGKTALSQRAAEPLRIDRDTLLIKLRWGRKAKALFVRRHQWHVWRIVANGSKSAQYFLQSPTWVLIGIYHHDSPIAYLVDDYEEHRAEQRRAPYARHRRGCIA